MPLVTRAAEPAPHWLTRPDGAQLAFRHAVGTPGARSPAVMFLHGLRSDMQGAKAAALASAATARGWEFLRLDLSGHGSSDGAFEDCTITRWVEDAQAALALTRGRPTVLVGSSLGGWLALRLALLRPDQIVGLLLVAPAIDMTRRIRDALRPEQRGTLDATGIWHHPSRWSGPIPITRSMFDDGEQHCLLDRPIRIDCPVRILHGQNDREIAWRDSLALADRLTTQDVRITLVKDGDHRLSEPAHVSLLLQALTELRTGCVFPVTPAGL